MAKVKEGDRVRIQTPNYNEADKADDIYPHMQGLTGIVANYYNDQEIAIQVDLDSLEGIPKDVHEKATKRMQAKLEDNLPQEAKKLMEKDELKFTPHYVLLVREKDLVKL